MELNIVMKCQYHHK